jgi:ketosteroid isomerase-like protein
MTAGSASHDLPDDEQAIRDVNTEFYAAVEECDLDRMAAVWAGGGLAAGVACVHPGWPMLRGRDEVLRSWALIMANTLYIQFFLTDVKVELSGDVAVLTCAENILTGVGSRQGEGPSSALTGGRMVATNVFRRTPEGWRLWLHHGSPVLDAGSSDDPGGMDEQDGMHD